jgi:hypothetical protein
MYADVDSCMLTRPTFRGINSLVAKKTVGHYRLRFMKTRNLLKTLTVSALLAGCATAPYRQHGTVWDANIRQVNRDYTDKKLTKAEWLQQKTHYETLRGEEMVAEEKRAATVNSILWWPFSLSVKPVEAKPIE